MKPSATQNFPKLDAVITDESYDDRQLGQVMRLCVATATEQNEVGYEEGYADGSDAAYGDGFHEGHELGFTAGEQAATIKHVYVGVWSDDEAVGDLGTNVRLVGVALTRERALALAMAYRDKRTHGSVFSFSFKVDRF